MGKRGVGGPPPAQTNFGVGGGAREDLKNLLGMPNLKSPLEKESFQVEYETS